MTCAIDTPAPREADRAVAEALRQLFGDIDGEAVAALTAALRCRSLARGARLFDEGDPGDTLFIVLDGRLAALLPGGRRREMGRGEVVGELAILRRAPRSATVVADRDSVLVALSRRSFERVVAAHPSVLLGLTRALAERIDAPAAERASRVGTVAVLSLLDGPTTNARVAELCAALGRRGPVHRVDAGAVAARSSGPGGAARDPLRQLPVRRWLSGLAAEHRHLVLDVRPGAPAWRRLAFDVADRVLVLVRPGEAPPPELVPILAQIGVHRVRVVLCHDHAPAGPTGAVAWRDRLPGVQVLHAVDGFDAVARRLDGAGVGLVLGGGGARAFAHIGVVRALAEAGVPIDHVAGSSMGALIGAGVARGMDWRALRELALRIWSGDGMRPRWTLPVFSLLDVGRNEQATRAAFGELDLLDLPRPLLVTASDITGPALRVLDTGPVWRALRMTGAFPGLSAPVPDGGRIHVDGGLFNNLPTDVLRERYPGPLLASDVGVARALDTDPAHTAAPAPRVRHLLGRRSRRFPTLAQVLVRVVRCGDAMRSGERRALADHCFTPRADDIGLMHFHRLDEAIGIGYRHAARAIEGGALAGRSPC